MSQALRDVIPNMGLLQEMREQDFKVLCTEPYVYCKVFEDNSGALELARLPKLRPRTKHINVCYHHFCEHVQKGLIKIFPVDTKDQIADALIKPLAQNVFQRHRRFMCSKSPSQATKVRECYVLSTLVLIFRCMSRSIVISSFSLSDQLNFTVTKCVVSSSVFRSGIKIIKQIYFQLQHQHQSMISHEFRARPSSMLLI